MYKETQKAKAEPYSEAEHKMHGKNSNLQLGSLGSGSYNFEAGYFLC